MEKPIFECNQKCEVEIRTADVENERASERAREEGSGSVVNVE